MSSIGICLRSDEIWLADFSVKNGENDQNEVKIDGKELGFENGMFVSQAIKQQFLYKFGLFKTICGFWAKNSRTLERVSKSRLIK